MTKVLTPEQTVFESKTCGRCGGSGSYSFNLMHGSRCYGCGGQGVVLTARGKAAKLHLIELQMKPVADVQVGDFIWFETMSNDGQMFSARWRKVEAIEPSACVRIYNGVEERPYVDLKTKAGSWGVPHGDRVRSIRDEEERKATVAAALAYQATLTKTGKPSKR